MAPRGSAALGLALLAAGGFLWLGTCTYYGCGIRELAVLGIVGAGFAVAASGAVYQRPDALQAGLSIAALGMLGVFATQFGTLDPLDAPRVLFTVGVVGMAAGAFSGHDGVLRASAWVAALGALAWIPVVGPDLLAWQAGNVLAVAGSALVALAHGPRARDVVAGQV